MTVPIPEHGMHMTSQNTGAGIVLCFVVLASIREERSGTEHQINCSDTFDRTEMDRK